MEKQSSGVAIICLSDLRSLILVASSLLSLLVLAVTRKTLIQYQPFFRPEVSEGRESTTYESDQHGGRLSFPEKVHISGHAVCHAPVYALAVERWVPEWVKHKLILSETHVLMMYVYAELSILNRDEDGRALKDYSCGT